MTMNDEIEILQNTLDMLDVLYIEYDVKKFIKMVHTIPYDTELIPNQLTQSLMLLHETDAYIEDYHEMIENNIVDYNTVNFQYEYKGHVFARELIPR